MKYNDLVKLFRLFCRFRDEVPDIDQVLEHDALQGRQDAATLLKAQEIIEKAILKSIRTTEE
jgi:hypothetical protein